MRTVFSFGLTDGVARNLGRRGTATLEPDELASNPELRGVVETLCNSLRGVAAKKIDKVCLTPSPRSRIFGSVHSL